MNSEVLIVLGMHRSGTSCIAKCLSKMNVDFYLPKINDGFWEKHIEYYQVNQLNDRILKNWKNPVLRRNLIIRKFYEFMVWRFVASNFNEPVMKGLKDPRLCLTYDYWEKHFKTIKIIGIFRRPEEVAKSLEIRDDYGKTSLSNGLKLWRMYNETLLKIHNKKSFPLLNFNLNKEQFGKSLKKACEVLNIEFSLEAFNETFYDKNKHHYFETVPETCLEVYSELLTRAI